MSKIAVILFNLGGPDKLENVKPFLYNLFRDPNIIQLPTPFRQLLAKLISSRREKTAQEIYKEIGGYSPIVENTQKQLDGLQKKLPENVKLYMAMRYWHPLFEDVIKDVMNDKPDQIFLLPLYPQFSTTTTGSAFKYWDDLAKKHKLTIPTKKLCCYPKDMNFVEAQAQKIIEKLENLKDFNDLRILFSAHGLPKKIANQGDPYCWQIEQSSLEIMKIVESKFDHKFDWLVSYQSKVGPLEWTKPYTEDEIERAGKDAQTLMIIPIAFVSEHSETLVELDIEYKEVADEAGVKEYVRVDTVGEHNVFIEGLSKLISKLIETDQEEIISDEIMRICPANFKKCPKTVSHL